MSIRSQLAVAAGLLLVLAVPIPYVIVPAWATQLVDISGRPQAGVRAVESWRHPLFQPERLQEIRVSDAQGRVEFPERKASSTGFMILYRAAAVLANAGLTASFAPDVAIAAAKDGFNGSDFYLSGRDPASTVILHRDGVCPADELPVGKAAPKA